MHTSRLNAICPYFTMYPLDFPLRILAAETGRNKWVFDPFCGRGTTNLAARLKGLPTVGVDSSPVAVSIAEAKVASASPRSVLNAAMEILKYSPAPRKVPRSPFWHWAFEENTLIDLCRLREELLYDCVSPSRKILRAILLGALHGPLCKSQPSYFSNQCPRTFAPKPAYALRYWKKHKMRPPTVELLSVIRRRAERFLSPILPKASGAILLRDSRTWSDRNFENRFSWVITSPPYYGMRTYIPDQWLRSWFVGGDSEVEYLARSSDLHHSGPIAFSAQLRSVWLNAARMSKPDARLVCRFGGI